MQSGNDQVHSALLQVMKLQCSLHLNANLTSLFDTQVHYSLADRLPALDIYEPLKCSVKGKNTLVSDEDTHASAVDSNMDAKLKLPSTPFSTTPFSVTIPSMRAAGVISNAGFHTSISAAATLMTSASSSIKT